MTGMITSNAQYAMLCARKALRSQHPVQSRDPTRARGLPVPVTEFDEGVTDRLVEWRGTGATDSKTATRTRPQAQGGTSRGRVDDRSSSTGPAETTAPWKSRRSPSSGAHVRSVRACITVP